MCVRMNEQKRHIIGRLTRALWIIIVLAVVLSWCGSYVPWDPSNPRARGVEVSLNVHLLRWRLSYRTTWGLARFDWYRIRPTDTGEWEAMGGWEFYSLTFGFGCGCDRDAWTLVAPHWAMFMLSMIPIIPLGIGCSKLGKQRRVIGFSVRGTDNKSGHDTGTQLDIN
jgi:hypothetical protein